MLRLGDDLPSGNGCKVRLLLTQLDTAFERIELEASEWIDTYRSFWEKRLGHLESFLRLLGTLALESTTQNPL